MTTYEVDYMARFDREEARLQAACAAWKDGDPVVFISSWDILVVCKFKTSSCPTPHVGCRRCTLRISTASRLDTLLAKGQNYRNPIKKDWDHRTIVSMYGV